MKQKDIICGIHYSALHLNSIYNGGVDFKCPKSEELQYKTVSLPMNEDLTDEGAYYIINKVKEILNV